MIAVFLSTPTVFTILPTCIILGMSYKAKLLWWSSLHTIFRLLCSDYRPLIFRKHGYFRLKIGFEKYAKSQPRNNPPLHVQKERNFLCKNRLKIGCSNYIKNLAEKSCFFKAYRRLSLKIYAKESNLYGAISCVLHFTQVPRAVFAIHTIFAAFRIGMERNCL